MSRSEVFRWIRVFFPLLFALSFSRFLVQTDLYFLRAFPDAIILLSFLSQISAIDAILAFAVVPVSLIVVSQYKSFKIRNAMVGFSFLLGGITSVFSFVFSILLFYLLEMDAKLQIPHTVFWQILLISTLTIPFRWLQLSTTSLLHMEKRGSTVVLVSFVSLFLNFFLNDFFMNTLAFGYTGCWFATLLVTAITSLFFAAKLKTTFSKNLFIERGIFVKAKMKIFHEGLRVLLQKGGYAILAALLLSAAIEKSITVQFGVLLELQNFFMILSVVIYRTTIIFNDVKNKNSVKKYFPFGLTFNLLTGVVIFFSAEAITSVYQLKTNQVLLFYLKTKIVAILFNSFAAFMRAKIQLSNKFMDATVIESCIMYLFLIPFAYITLTQKIYLGVVAGFLLSSFFVNIIYYFKFRKQNNKAA